MKDPMMTNGEPIGEVSSLKRIIPGKVDSFRWETAYRELGQSQFQQKLTAESLRKSENKYRRLVETTKDWVWAMDLEGRHTYSNPAIYQLLGYQVDEVVGANAFPPVFHEDEQPTREMMKQCIEQKAGWQNFSIRRVHKDGSVRSFESTAGPIVNANGRIEGFSGIDRDITERKRLEAVRQKAHDELEQRMAERTDELVRLNDERRTEASERKRLKAALQQAHDELERRMAERTDELVRLNGERRREASERKRLEAELQQAHDELERRVVERTDELVQLNGELRKEVTERQRAEAALQEAHDELERHVAERTDELVRLNGELRKEVIERQGVEAALQQAHDELERRVAERTDELMRVNGGLQAEVTERKRAEAALQEAHDELERRVAERTNELVRVTDELRTEVAERQRVEAAIHTAKNDWERTFDNLKKTIGTTIHVMGSTKETGHKMEG